MQDEDNEKGNRNNLENIMLTGGNLCQNLEKINLFLLNFRTS